MEPFDVKIAAWRLATTWTRPLPPDETQQEAYWWERAAARVTLLLAMAEDAITAEEDPELVLDLLYVVFNEVRALRDRRDVFEDWMVRIAFQQIQVLPSDRCIDCGESSPSHTMQEFDELINAIKENRSARRATAAGGDAPAA